MNHCVKYVTSYQDNVPQHSFPFHASSPKSVGIQETSNAYQYIIYKLDFCSYNFYIFRFSPMIRGRLMCIFFPPHIGTQPRWAKKECLLSLARIQLLYGTGRKENSGTRLHHTLSAYWQWKLANERSRLSAVIVKVIFIYGYTIVKI